MRAVIALAALALLVAACGEEDSVTSPTERPAPTTVTTQPQETSGPTDSTVDPEDLSAEAREVVEEAVADLAERTGASPEEIRVVSFEQVTWNDGSLGCPEPGKAYTQALVDGWRAVLEWDGTTYDYHAGSDGAPFLCENPRIGAGVPSTAAER